jgi:pimeloyl-ACP methyl ester carboxylesterase
MQLHHKSYGSGPAIILLHGLLGAADNWHPVALALAGRFQVFALDQRNHGLSPHTGEMNYRLMAEDVNEFLEANGIARAVVAGHSMGGKTAMQFALQFPDKVEKLLVEDMAPRAYAPSHAPILAAMRALDLARFTSRADIEHALAPEIPSLTLRRFLLKNLGRDSAGKFFWKINLTGLAENYPRLGEPVSHPEPSRPEPFTKPALFIRGGKSNYLGDADEPLIRELFPNAEFQTIPAAGHWIHADQLEAFLALMLDFL